MSEREIQKWQDVFQCLPFNVRARITRTANEFYDEHPEARGRIEPRAVIAATVRAFYIHRRLRAFGVFRDHE